MARAKKTDRSEARRRARLAAVDAEGQSFASDADDATATPASGAVSARPGIFGAFRGSINSVDVRADLRQIPWLITKTKSVWLPSVLVVASTIWFGVSGGATAQISFLAFNLFVFPPPLAAAFLAGILTPRMSYLAGGIVGLVSAIVFSVYILIGNVPTNPSMDERQRYVLYALAISPLSGLAIGGFAGFYRRFLRRANPQAGQRPQSRGKSNRAPARR